MSRYDFNGDGRSDILWILGDSLAVGDWLAKTDGTFLVNDTNSLQWLTAMHRYDLRAVGDFNGDGRSDLLWQIDRSEYFLTWYGAENGGFPDLSLGGSWFQMSDPSWKIVGSGDFNGDGYADLLWRNDNGAVGNWLGTANGSFVINNAGVKGVSKSWAIAGVGDFNGDGRDDILWQSDTGYVGTWLGQADGNYFINDGNLTRLRVAIVAIGDFNGDGRDDLVLNDDWQFYSVVLTGANANPEYGEYLPFADSLAGWTINAVGDYNGDGTDDLLMRHTDGSLTYWTGGAGSGYEFTQTGILYHVENQWHVVDTLL